MRSRGKIAVACFVAVLLAAFGINNIGGDTWISAGAPLPDGFQRNPHGPVPPHTAGRLAPILTAVTVVALAAGALLYGYRRRGEESDAADDDDGANVTTPSHHGSTET